MCRTLLIAVVGGAVLSLAACASGDAVDARRPVPAPLAGEDSAARALLRYMAAYNDVGTAESARVSTLCVGRGRQVNELTDPAPALLRRLQRTLDRVVVPASRCSVGARATGADGQPARLIFVDEPREDRPQTFIFRGGYYEDKPGAATGRYRVARSADDWYITPKPSPDGAA